MDHGLSQKLKTARYSFWEIVALVVILAPGPVTFVAYVLWVIYNGGDPDSGQGPLYPTVHEVSLTARSVGSIAFNGIFNAVTASIAGVAVAMLIAISRAAKEDLEGFYRWHENKYGRHQE